MKVRTIRFSRTEKNKGLLALQIALLLVTSLSCAPKRTPGLSTQSEKYHPILLAQGAQVGPGGMSWSEDGKTLAFIAGGGVTLYNTASTAKIHFPLDSPHFLVWTADHTLHILYKERGRDALCSIDRKELSLRTAVLDDGAEALYPTADNKGLLILSKKVKKYSFGTEIDLRLSTLTNHGDAAKPFYVITKSYPVQFLDLRYFLSWTHAGLNPIDKSLLVFEQVKPPAMPPYSRIITVDSLTGDIIELTGHAPSALYASAGWSPDGKLLAVSTTNGSLELLTFRGDRTILDQAATGFYPSWSPRGNRIYFGGYLIDPEGKNREPLLLKDPWSIAAWSPDGTKLASVTDGNLWLFKDIGNAPGVRERAIDAASVQKMRLLRALVRDKLITPEEYREQQNTIMKGSEYKQ